MNTVLIVEPRRLDILAQIIYDCKKFGTSDWAYVFYCGKSSVDYWSSRLDSSIELRPLPVDNFTSSDSYNDFMKSKSLWESLTGEYVLTLQADCWLLNKVPLATFLRLNKSFIGGNQNYIWPELIRERISFSHYNFNGGLSLRKRKDLIRICDAFPPQPTVSSKYALTFTQDAEDVYFTIGCKKLGMDVGDDEICSQFAIHGYFKDAAFGIHNPCNDAVQFSI